MKKYKFSCPICNKEVVTTDYYYYWDFKVKCDECGKTNYFNGGILCQKY